MHMTTISNVVSALLAFGYWLVRMASPNPSTRYARLAFELLETRVTPTTFTWTGAAGAGAAGWNQPGNWNVGGGTYPGWNGTAATTNDTAVFDSIPVTANRICNLTAPVEIATLELTSVRRKMRNHREFPVVFRD